LFCCSGASRPPPAAHASIAPSTTRASRPPCCACVYSSVHDSSQPPPPAAHASCVYSSVHDSSQPPPPAAHASIAWLWDPSVVAATTLPPLTLSRCAMSKVQMDVRQRQSDKAPAARAHVDTSATHHLSPRSSRCRGKWEWPEREVPLLSLLLPPLLPLQLLMARHCPAPQPQWVVLLAVSTGMRFPCTAWPCKS
jgi:hypothetical protein